MSADLEIYVNESKVNLQPTHTRNGDQPEEPDLFGAVETLVRNNKSAVVRVVAGTYGHGVASSLARDIRLRLGPDVPIRVDGQGQEAKIEVG